MRTYGYAATNANQPLAPFVFERRELRPNDIAFDILYCGVCHSDLHYVRNDWGISRYPLVPGHELVGRVTAVGNKVTSHRIGDLVAVGTIVDSCSHCDMCLGHEEQLCRNGASYTYSSKDLVTGETTQGGYSKHFVVRDDFALKMPEGLDPSRVGPLLCAGITTYTPLKNYNIGPGSRVGVVGIGGLGHLAVKLAVAMGAEVTVITRSRDKADEAKALGAHKVLLSSAGEAMAGAAFSLDLIIDTIPVSHDVTPYLALLDFRGTLMIVGQLGQMEAFNSFPLLGGRRRIEGSGTGGLAATQELLNFCAEKNVLPECEIISIQDINAAFERMERGDVRYRFVIDMATLVDVA
ncbi:MAG TPA: NAD(P)-dependent alcohol dehydrogenase [Herbaspirillum sp.]|jgi:uncharacterized zinc-type alcohol dehydrogenase-like protein